MTSLGENKVFLARVGFMLVIWGIFAGLIPSYTTVVGLGALLDASVLVGVVAIGVGLTMIAGEMDLSVGSVAAVCGVISVMCAPLGVGVSITLTTVLGLLFGLLQGWLIQKLNISSIVFTIGSLIGLRGVALVISGEKTQNIPFDQFESIDFLSLHWGIFSVPSLVLIVVAILVAAFFNYTVWGRNILAIGGGRSEARAAGVPVRGTIILVFGLSGALAALAGAVVSLRAGSASPLGYDALVLDAVTACLIGGIALSGGIGSVGAILIGVMTMRFLVSGIAALGAPFWLQNLTTGALLIIVIFSEAAIASVMRMRRLRRTI